MSSSHFPQSANTPKSLDRKQPLLYIKFYRRSRCASGILHFFVFITNWFLVLPRTTRFLYFTTTVHQNIFLLDILMFPKIHAIIFYGKCTFLYVDHILQIYILIYILKNTGKSSPHNVLHILVHLYFKKLSVWSVVQIR